MGFKEYEFLIGTFANFRLQKNHANLIKAISLLENSGKTKPKLLLCGSGPTESDIRELVHELKIDEYVSFMGIRSDIPELMNIIDIYCLPSHYEGLPFSILEAMASGKPVVATDVPRRQAHPGS